MASDIPQDTPPHPRLSRGLLFAGVAAAGVLGVGLGLWARPADSERHPGRAGAMHAAKPPAPEPTRSLEIVVDDRPAEIGGPIEVMAGGAPSAAQAAVPAAAQVQSAPIEIAPSPESPLLAPRPEPQGLVRVQAVEPAAPLAPPRPEPKAKKAEPAERVEAPAPRPKLVKAAAVKTGPARLEKTKARAEPKPARPVKVKAEAPAKARPAKPSLKVAKAERAAKDRLRQAEVKLAKAETRAKPKLAALLHVLKRKPHEQAAERPLQAAKAQKVSDRRAKPAERPKLTKAAARPATPKVPAPPRLTKVANRCASPDPGAAVVCADPSLGAADRELGRAYRQAEAAGVPSWRLQQQQQRWLAARANAAREAPWAVRDVYQARIAELRDQTRSAQGAY